MGFTLWGYWTTLGKWVRKVGSLWKHRVCFIISGISITAQKSKSVFYHWTSMNWHLHCHFYSPDYQIMWWCFFIGCLSITWLESWVGMVHTPISFNWLNEFSSKFSPKSILTWLDLWLQICSTSFLSAGCAAPVTRRCCGLLRLARTTQVLVPGR